MSKNIELNEEPAQAIRPTAIVKKLTKPKKKEDTHSSKTEPGDRISEPHTTKPSNQTSAVSESRLQSFKSFNEDKNLDKFYHHPTKPLDTKQVKVTNQAAHSEIQKVLNTSKNKAHTAVKEETISEDGGAPAMSVGGGAGGTPPVPSITDPTTNYAAQLKKKLMRRKAPK